VDTAIKDTTPLPATFYLRAFVLFSGPTAPVGRVAFLSLVEPNAPDYDSVELDINGGKYGAGDSLFVPSSWASSLTIPLGTWVCAEWQVTSGDAGTVRAWMAGSEVTALARTGRVPPPGIISVGLASAPPQPQGPYDAWIDDLLVSTQPIGCEK
jgi:hypothetical protein